MITFESGLKPRELSEKW